MGKVSHRFGVLESLDERRLPARAGGGPERRRDGDVVTYVREGALAYVSSIGHAGVIHAGEFQRVTAANQVAHRERNASHRDSAHVFQVGLRGSGVEREPSHEQRRFSVAHRRGAPLLIASPDARRESLRVHHDAFVYSAVLHAGQHVVHELVPERSAWVHVVQGRLRMGEMTLETGDGAGVFGQNAVSFTAQCDGEILLVDVGLRTQPTD